MSYNWVWSIEEDIFSRFLDFESVVRWGGRVIQFDRIFLGASDYSDERLFVVDKLIKALPEIGDMQMLISDLYMLARLAARYLRGGPMYLCSSRGAFIYPDEPLSSWAIHNWTVSYWCVKAFASPLPVLYVYDFEQVYNDHGGSFPPFHRLGRRRLPIRQVKSLLLMHMMGLSAVRPVKLKAAGGGCRRKRVRLNNLHSRSTDSMLYCVADGHYSFQLTVPEVHREFARNLEHSIVGAWDFPLVNKVDDDLRLLDLMTQHFPRTHDQDRIRDVGMWVVDNRHHVTRGDYELRVQAPVLRGGKTVLLERPMVVDHVQTIKVCAGDKFIEYVIATNFGVQPKTRHYFAFRVLSSKEWEYITSYLAI